MESGQSSMKGLPTSIGQWEVKSENENTCEFKSNVFIVISYSIH